VWKLAENRYIIMITDVPNRKVLSVTAQTADDESQRTAVDIAASDPRVMELLNTPFHGTSTSDTFTPEARKLLNSMGFTDISKLVEFTVWVLPPSLTHGDYVPYSFVIDIDAGTVTYLGNLPPGGELENGLWWYEGASGGLRN
jgi:hypothetical protein